MEASRRVRRAVRSATKAPHPCSDPARPYHETLTLAWTRLVAAHIDPAEEDFESFLTRHPFLRDRVSVLAYYSPERLGSDRARHEFVLPDRAPLPSLPSFSQLGVSE